MKNKEFIVVVLTVIGLYTCTDPITADGSEIDSPR